METVAEHTASPEANWPVSEIKVIFWDIGGVLLTNGWDLDQRARVLGSLDVDVAEYETRHDAANFFWERGLTTAETFFAKTVFHPDQPSRAFSYDELWGMVCAESHVLHEGSFALLKAMRGAGRYRVATLNNESRELNEYRLDAFGLRGLFDFFICSGYVHEMKPHPAIYRAAVEISGFAAGQTLFIDDKQENCDAAVSQGMNAIRFDSPTQLTHELLQRGIQAA
jgi:putative hydrolase of the HAD superfamily